MKMRPSFVIKRVTDISIEWLKKNRFEGLLIDIDNTLTPYHSEQIPDDIMNWLHTVTASGIRFVPYSNARLYRIKNFCERFQIQNPGIAIKPLNLGLNKALKVLGVSKERTLLIGDQVFTDCLAGKFARIKTVLVNPISANEFPATRFMRYIERLIGRSKWKFDDFR